MVYCLDLDGVICKTGGLDYEHSRPHRRVIQKINDLYYKGHTIKIFTSRGMKTGLNWRELTENQLREWGLKYHELIFGKPYYDVMIDDRAVNVKEWLRQPS